METLQFKTNINCSGGIAKVTPLLNTKEGIDKWDIVISDLSGILTVKTDFLSAKVIIQEVERIGFKIEKLE
jgi:copper chaperone